MRRAYEMKLHSNKTEIHVKLYVNVTQNYSFFL
jgi:hypothetical protein